MRTTALLFLFAIIMFSMAACATPEQTTAAIAAVGSTAAALIDALAPIIPPEKLAALQATAGHIDGTVQATATAVHTLAEAVSQINAKAGAQIAAVADSVAKATHEIASLPTRTEVYEIGAGTGAAGTAVSRLMSVKKHGFAGTAAKPA